MLLLPTEIISYSALGLSAVCVVLLILIYLKIKNTYHDEEKFLASDKNFRSDLSNKIEELALAKIEEITRASSSNIEGEVKKFALAMAKLTQEKSLEISNFIQKQEEEQVKESQFFVANSLARVEHEIDEYRKNKLEKIDSEIRQIVFSAAREVIGRAISLSEHEDLVSKALERAKKDRVFG